MLPISDLLVEVDGAMHRAGGPAIMVETQQKYPQGCPTDSAVLTAAGNLRARYIILPLVPSGMADSNVKRNSWPAHIGSLEIAVAHGCHSIALPALSTGAYGYPLRLAAQITLRTVLAFLTPPHPLSLVRLVLFDQPTWDVFATALQQHGQRGPFYTRAC